VIGGVSKTELLSRLHAAQVRLNELAQELFADPRFVTRATASRIETIELTAADLGLTEGGTRGAILQRAADLGLSNCPLEVGPHLRLNLLDQPEGFIGQPSSWNEAPPKSITVISELLAADDSAPAGFYLRRIEGSLWLRGYRSWSGHVWSSADHLVFTCASDAG
jgi:hypothetical protein